MKRPVRPVVKEKAPDAPATGVSLSLEIGVLTSACFIVSAAWNAIAFWREWDISYFAIATPADVIMGGFPVVFGMVVAAALSCLAFLLANPRTWRVLLRREAKGSSPVSRPVFARILIASFLMSAVTQFGFVMMADGPVSGWTGLFTNPDARALPANCRGRPVRWSGSEAALIQCDDHIRVVRDFDGIALLVPTGDRP